MNAAAAYAARIDAVAAQEARLGLAQPDRWSRAAPRFRADPHRPHDETLRAIAAYLHPQDVLVDAGGGAGRLGLALAGRCREVVNVEPAAGMRGEFTAAAADAGISNARLVAAEWLDAAGVEGDLVLTCDVTYFVRTIEDFVAKLDAAARRRVLIVLGSVPPPNMNARVFQLAFGEEQAPVPGQRELLPVLWDLDLLPEVLVLSQSPLFPDPPHLSLSAAVEALMTRAPFAGNERARQAIEAHSAELFRATPEGYLPAWRPTSRTLLITWEKQDRARA
jgi:hypothetical protein